MSVPNPELLFDSPELAALAVLDTALVAATNSLIAVNGELMSDDFIRDLAAAPAVHACLAAAIIAHIDGLQAALERYRAYLAHANSKGLALRQVF